MGDRTGRETAKAYGLAVVTGVVLFAIGASTGVGVSAADEPTVTFSAAGDYGMNVNGDAVLRGMQSSGNDLTLALGDMLGAGGVVGTEGTFCDYVTDRVGAGYPFELIAGNHDNGSNGNINDFSACLPNQLPGLVGTYGRQYYVDYPQTDPLVRFVMVSPNMSFNGASAWNYNAGSARYQWTAKAIDDARTAGIPWVVAGMHYQCLSVGMYACPMGADLANLFVAKKVDLVLTGHEHLYQRSKQLAHTAGCTALTIGSYAAPCVTDADDTLTKGAGTVFLTVGLGGVQNRAVDAADPEADYFAALSGSNLESSYGFLSTSLTAQKLTARFVNAVGPFTDAFTIDTSTEPPSNQPPITRLAVTCADLVCQNNGTASTDPDGTITSYSWAFGDGTTGSGATVAHSYTAAGTYVAELTVTDDDGATSTASQSVTVTAANSPTIYASDGFNRTASGSWGTADVGGAWSANSALSVSGGNGVISVAAGAAPSVSLASVSALDVNLRTAVSFEKIPASGTSGSTISAFVRRTATGRYWVKIRVAPSGATYLTISRLSSTGAETPLASEVLVPGATLSAGTVLNVRLRVTGASPTTVSARAWVGGTEPTSWNRTATDSTAGLQAPGSVGLQTYTSTSVTNGPIRMLIPEIEVTTAP